MPETTAVPTRCGWCLKDVTGVHSCYDATRVATYADARDAVITATRTYRYARTDANFDTLVKRLATLDAVQAHHG